MTESVSRSTHCHVARRRGVASALGLSAFALLPTRAAQATITDNRGQNYVNECALAGVPTPPPFNYEDAFHNRPTSEWTYEGVLDVTFAGGPEQTAEVFYYESASPEGVCIALPRSIFPPGQTPDEGPPIFIDLLGVICQGVVSGKACFWDHGTQYIVEGVDPFVTMTFGDGEIETTFRGGADLVDATGSAPGGVCTDCHRGENVFFIHPETPLGFVPSRMPDIWHDPIVPEDWPENPGPGTLFPAPDSGCALGACHFSPASGRFPTLSTEAGSYCRLLERTLGVSMPLGAVDADLAVPPFSDSLELIRAACRSAPPPEENAPQQAMSFDGPAEQFWSAEFGSLSDVTGNQTEGEGAMSVDASGYVRLDSLPFSTWELPVIGSQLLLDVFVPPAGQPNPFWLGAVQLYVTIPSARMTNNFIGQVELTPGGLGWRAATFPLSAEVQAALSQAHSDVRWGIAVNTPQGAPPVQLDNMRFAGTLSPPPAPPSLTGIQFDFERGGAWTGFDGAVVYAGNATLEAYTGSGSLRVDINGSSDGRVYTAPASSPAAGSTVRYRVYIPSGAPISSVQPYIMDQNWVWSDSWNPNLPRDGWVTLTVTVPPNATLPLQEIGVKFYLNGSYTGPVYLDAIEW